MASPFDDLDNLLSSAVVTAYGEAAIITPRTSSQYAVRTSDQNRNSANVWGVFSAGVGESPIKGLAVGGEFSGTTRFNTSKSEFWLSADQVSALGFAPAKGDKISFPGRPGAPVYSVSAIQNTNMGDMALVLVREDQSE